VETLFVKHMAALAPGSVTGYAFNLWNNIWVCPAPVLNFNKTTVAKFSARNNHGQNCP
jgi:hypothetical protein